MSERYVCGHGRAFNVECRDCHADLDRPPKADPPAQEPQPTLRKAVETLAFARLATNPQELWSVLIDGDPEPLAEAHRAVLYAALRAAPEPQPSPEPPRPTREAVLEAALRSAMRTHRCWYASGVVAKPFESRDWNRDCPICREARAALSGERQAQPKGQP